ncbi:MAG TPA: GGDEF domain-containing protein, partial [Beijerinckiaceae bacterium]|nr:GGDEF domain-containing protein [Beijerinckiaceae bacterium]
MQISIIVAIASAICLGLLAGFLLDTSLVLPAAITGLVVPCAVLPWMTFHAIDSRRQLNETLTALEGLAKMDTTTHLPNRAAFRESGKAMFDRLKAGSEPLSAVLIDVDHLDQINQTHGYDLGDAVLAHAAELLNLNIQTGVDLAARYGGAEFILLLPQADEGWASAFAERLRGAFANRALEHKGAYINVSASFGVAALQPGD